MHHQCHPVPDDRLRTMQNYAHDVALQDYTETGITENCSWNDVPSYHCVENKNCEIMHDILEGALKYDICKILYYLIVVRCYFSLETLLERIDGFDYGPNELCNKPPTSHITVKKLEKCTVNLSASEMLCLGRYLGEMVGDLVPEGNGVWKLYLIIREILEIIMSPVLEEGVDLYRETLVLEHHKLYLYYFGNLKPKHHFMVHYGTLLRQNGPLILLSALMCERNHRRGKLYAHVSNSRVDLALSMALKFQLYLCERLMRPDNFVQNLKTTKKSSIPFETLDHYNYFLHSLPFHPDVDVTVVQSVEVYGTQYSIGMILVVKVGELLPSFGKIVHILLRENSVIFVTNVLTTINYRSHICAYEVTDSDEFLCVEQCNLLYFTPLWQRTAVSDGKNVVSLRHLL